MTTREESDDFLILKSLSSSITSDQMEDCSIVGLFVRQDSGMSEGEEELEGIENKDLTKMKTRMT